MPQAGLTVHTAVESAECTLSKGVHRYEECLLGHSIIPAVCMSLSHSLTAAAITKVQENSYMFHPLPCPTGFLNGIAHLAHLMM